MQHLKDEQEEVGKRGERVLCNVWLQNSMKSARIPTHRKDSNQKYSVCGGVNLRVTLLVGDMGWVDIDLGCSSILPSYPANFAKTVE